MPTATHKLKFKTGVRSAKTIIEAGTQPARQPQGRLPRITKMMALAIRLDHLIQTGQVTDQAELSRIGHVSRARLTQIMNLLSLAPDIQDELLHLPTTLEGRAWVTERDVRLITATLSWNKQRKLWPKQPTE